MSANADSGRAWALVSVAALTMLGVITIIAGNGPAMLPVSLWHAGDVVFIVLSMLTDVQIVRAFAAALALAFDIGVIVARSQFLTPITLDVIFVFLIWAVDATLLIIALFAFFAAVRDMLPRVRTTRSTAALASMYTDDGRASKSL